MYMGNTEKGYDDVGPEALCDLLRESMLLFETAPCLL